MISQNRDLFGVNACHQLLFDFSQHRPHFLFRARGFNQLQRIIRRTRVIAGLCLLPRCFQIGQFIPPLNYPIRQIFDLPRPIILEAIPNPLDTTIERLAAAFVITKGQNGLVNLIRQLPQQSRLQGTKIDKPIHHQQPYRVQKFGVIVGFQSAQRHPPRPFAVNQLMVTQIVLIMGINRGKVLVFFTLGFLGIKFKRFGVNPGLFQFKDKLRHQFHKTRLGGDIPKICEAVFGGLFGDDITQNPIHTRLPNLFLG